MLASGLYPGLWLRVDGTPSILQRWWSFCTLASAGHTPPSSFSFEWSCSGGRLLGRANPAGGCLWFVPALHVPASMESALF